MAIEINFIASRPDTSTDFYWESTDSQIVNDRNTIVNLLSGINATVSFNKSADNLTHNTIYIVPDQDAAAVFRSTMAGQTAIMERRNQYFTSNNHSLSVRVVDTDINDTIFENILL